MKQSSRITASAYRHGAASGAIARRSVHRCCPSAPVFSADPVQTDAAHPSRSVAADIGGAGDARRMDANIGVARMKVAYVYEFEAEDITVQSGRPQAILQEMRARHCGVVPAFPLDQAASAAFYGRRSPIGATGMIYRPDRERHVLDDLAAQARRRMADTEIDCVFGPGSHAIRPPRDETGRLSFAPTRRSGTCSILR